MKKVFLVFVALTAHAQNGSEKIFTVCGKRVALEIARSAAERERGLMGREALPAGHGMLFVFDTEQPVAFWMKNVAFDIDIAFFDDKGRMLNATTMKGSSPMQRPETLPRYTSAAPARYAVELPRGFFSKTKSCRLSPLP